MPTVYVLKCEDDCYYVGQTQREYYEEVERHFKGEQMGWTKIHRPIKIDLLRFYCDENDVELYTRTYMLRYGVDKVRGGSHSNCVLTRQQVKDIYEHQHMDYVMCTKCAMYGHKSTKCPFSYVIPCLAIENSAKQHIENKPRHCLSSIGQTLWGIFSNLFRYRINREIHTNLYD